MTCRPTGGRNIELLCRINCNRRRSNLMRRTAHGINPISDLCCVNRRVVERECRSRFVPTLWVDIINLQRRTVLDYQRHFIRHADATCSRIERLQNQFVLTIRQRAHSADVERSLCRAAQTCLSTCRIIRRIRLQPVVQRVGIVRNIRHSPRRLIHLADRVFAVVISNLYRRLVVHRKIQYMNRIRIREHKRLHRISDNKRSRSSRIDSSNRDAVLR